MKTNLRFVLGALAAVWVSTAAAQIRTATIDSSSTHQTIEGIGGAICFYNGWFRAHPYKEEIYSNAFAGLNISMLRLGNWYRYQGNANFDLDAKEFVEKANSYLGRPVPVLMSSWAPPAFLKNNGEVGHGGSLIYTDGGFAYDAFAQYWYDALLAYEALGVKPTWISIQNEPDFEADYDSCVFRPTEQGTNFASYSIALDRVHRQLTNLPAPPKLLAPEVVHVAFNTLANYAATMDPNDFYGVAHHLYGDGGATADSYLGNLSAATNIFPNKPRFMTEYGELQDLIGCANLIHNCLVVEQVSGYNHWSLLWPGTGGGLIQIEFPWDQSQWTNAPPGTPTQSRGWWITPAYWAMKHYSFYIQPGFRRVSATDNDNNVLVSAYLSPDNLRLVAVLINTSASASSSMSLNPGAFDTGNSSVYQTVAANPWQSLGALANPLTLPPRSLTTVVLDRSVTVGAASNPSPTNGAGDISLYSSLGWTPGSNAVTHAVYFGTSSNAVANATPSTPEFRGIVATNSFPLAAAAWATTYYWRVDEIAYSSTNQGSVWRFQTAPPVQVPSPWQSQDIGGAVSQSSAIYNNGLFTVTGGGADIWGTSDAFRFVYVPVTGNCVITARVLSVQNVDPWSKAGVMIRTSLTANSANALVAVTPGNGVTWQYRSTAGGNSSNNNTTGLNAPYWVRLVRSGNTFTGYRSVDGVNWIQQGNPTTISMAATVYAGLALTSHNISTACTATFDNVTAPGWTVPAPPPAPGGLNGMAGSAQVELTWTAAAGATSYNLKRATTVGGPYGVITNVTTTQHTDAGLINGTTYYYVVSALNQAGESTNSIPVGATPQIFPPTSLIATAVSTAAIHLEWNASVNATAYNVKRSHTNGGPYETIATAVSATEYQDSGLVGGTVYYYVVSGKLDTEESADSVPVAAATHSPTLGSLVHRYSFNETGGSAIADSVGGPVWNGTVVNGGTLSGGQLALAAGSQHASLPTGIVSSLSNITVMAWVNLAATTYWSRIFDFGNDASSYMFLMPQNGFDYTARFAISTSGAGGEQKINSGVAVSPGGWRHVAVTVNSGIGILYLDGMAVGTNNNLTLNPSSLGSTTHNYIGRSQSASDPYLNGALDEFRIYNAALSAAEIAATAALGPEELLSPNNPHLNLTVTGSNLTLSWPLAHAGFKVQARTNLTSGEWVNVTSPAPEIVGDEWGVVLPVSESTPFIFYRLVK